MHYIVLSVLVVLAVGQDLFLAVSTAGSGNCSAYHKKNNSNNCAECGRCQNSGGRQGVICKGTQTGYYCPPEHTTGQDMAFACMDWTFGSKNMIAAETAFNEIHNDDVHFGVGTYGSTDDPNRGLGACFRVKVEGMTKELILQSINTGSDVAGTQFDMQVGDGGAGAFNTCAGGKEPGVDSMFPGTYEQSNWGHEYGGVDNRSQCENLPLYPEKDAAMRIAGDDLVTLCEYSFDKGARGEGGQNPSIQSIGRVKCPDTLVEMTQIQRNDDPAEYKCGVNCIEAPQECGLHHGTTAEWCLTRMMDCRKPSGAFIDNCKADLAVEGKRIAQPCTSDGYTRINVQCGCYDCYC